MPQRPSRSSSSPRAEALDVSSQPTAVPDAVLRRAAGRDVTLVWRNEAGGLTYELRGADGARFVKWQPIGLGPDLTQERDRLAWAGQFIAVPKVLEVGGSAEGTWMITAAVHGSSAVSERWLHDPATAVRAIGAGLRELHDRLPVDRCPFRWSAGERVADAQRRAGAGLLDPTSWHAEHRALTVREALSLVVEPPAVDRLVVCHGDACSPNTLIADDGRCSGHVDLGSLGLADRWADIAIATWSAEWNFGPGSGPALLAAYGVAADEARTQYYRLLWDLSA